MGSNYIPLYRKYRPQTLDTLVGQEHVKKTLTSAIELGRISHAYLFTGPRGTGKTSTARILAKSLNCKNGPTINPCGECESCKDITNSIPIDVIEIDAASNRKVEDTQSILEKIQYVPVNGKYKIYIIDEVHMLTNHAFNALLKTLEEPPENVIFILATTEVHKVLDTIKSRCQRFDFRRITTDDIVKHLRFISDKENINISDDALFTIAKNSAGGMRDSISLLDQLSLLGISKQITADDVNSVLGRISFDILFDLTEKIIKSSTNEAIELLNTIYNSGNEPLQILTNISEYLKNLLIVKTCSKDLLQELTGLNEPQIEEILKQKDSLETQQIVFLIERVTYYIKEVKQATNQHLWLEVGIIDLSNMTENSKLIDLQNRINTLEAGNFASPQPVVQQVVTRPAPIQPKPVMSQPAKNSQAPTFEKQTQVTPKPIEQSNEIEFTPPPMSKMPDGNDIGSLWGAMLANINSPSTNALLKLAIPIQISKEGVVLVFKSDGLVSKFSDSNRKQLIADAASAMFGTSDIPVTIKKGDGSEKPVQIVQQTTVAPTVQESTNNIQEKKTEFDIKTTSEPPQKTSKIEQAAEKTKQNENLNNTTTTTVIEEKEIKKIESDQEKMILDLFDGKYVE